MAYPVNRHSAASCYDTVRKQLWMYGGNQGLFFTGTNLQDCWTKTPAGLWTQITPTGGPGTGHCMGGSVYLPTQDRYLLACGRSGSSYLATAYWFDPATNAFTAKASAPQSRAYFGNALYLPSVDKVVIHGGYNGGGLSNTIVYTPGSNTWADLGTLANGPGSIGAGYWAYNSARGKGVYFGGDNLSARQNKTFEFDPSAQTFADRTTTGTKPPIRRNHCMWYDPVADAVFVYGGHNGSEFGAALTDLWKGVWNAGTSVYDWTQMATPALPTGPAGREYPAASHYDPDRLGGYIFGGCEGTSANFIEGQGFLYYQATDKWLSDLAQPRGGVFQPNLLGGFGG